MEVGSKVKSTFLSGVALCAVSGLLFILGTIGMLSQNAEIDSTFFLAPLFFLVTGVIAIAISQNKKIR